MIGEKSLHPFFTKPVCSTSNGTASNDEETDTADTAREEGDVDVKPKRKRKAKPNDGKTQKTLQELINPKPTDAAEDEAGYGVVAGERQEKRRRTSKDEFVEITGQPEVRDSTPATPTHRRMASPQVIISQSSPLPTFLPDVAPENPVKSKTPPKKLLRLNANGKFSSPPSKKPRDEVQAERPKRRGRPRKSKDSAVSPSLVVIVKYSRDSNAGHKIDRVMSGEDRVAATTESTAMKPRTPRKQKRRKPTHPFFTGKPKEEVQVRKQESPRKTSAITPGKLRRQALGDSSRHAPKADESWTSSLLKDRLMMKHPGAKEPAWPNKESTHVRGLDNDKDFVALQVANVVTLQRRKKKHAQLSLQASDSILLRYSSNLSPEKGGRLRDDGFREPHPSLSVPRRLLKPGEWLADQVQRNLATLWKSGGASTTGYTHPALRKLHDAIPHNLTAFDEGRGEGASWTQKYAPTTAEEVLQPSNEMNVLKTWLQSLTITAVEGHAKQEPKSVAKAELKAKKKRKRRTDGMDDFLVDSDEDVHDMIELADPEAPERGDKRHSALTSIVQAQAEGVKLSNAVLLIGPNGCGKTAAAHAVAKGLGFKVFEISPSERRSGKDVLDRIGDMTENHIVKHHGTDTAETSSAEEPSRFDDAFQRDLESGRQGKMASFFKPQLTTKPKLVKPQTGATTKQNALDGLQKVIRKPAKDQQQSLILLEEIDILFKDDKDFWTTVLRLISTSKRPFIMTCNDEELVPLQAMALHAILRFQPPAIALAVDYLLLVAASEGHYLTREAVVSLYTAKNYDLRASITELQFWCQMGVGDPKGGLSWIYQRYPPGSDLDENGQRLRVISQDTFQGSMGIAPPSALNETDQMLWKWQEFGLEPLISLGWQQMDSRHIDGRVSLKAYSSFAESMSADDVYCGSYCEADLDTTQKPMRERTRGQYVDGLRLLQSDLLPDYSSIRPSLAAATALSAHRTAGMFCSLDSSTYTTSHARTALTRKALTVFDPLATNPENHHLTPSAIDAPLSILTTDIAPYIRSIVTYDLALAAQRDLLHTSDTNSRPGKAARKTRAARSALEGSQRGSTRRERWFDDALDYGDVLATGGNGWQGAVEEVMMKEREMLGDGMDVVVSGEEDIPASSAVTAEGGDHS